jgi:TRAP-type uncharacterized transport system fused permease subunit
VRFTQFIIDLSSGMLWLGAVLTMIACIVLGMGLPTTAAYIITAVLGAPALAEFGVPLQAAHMFIFYFAIVSFITPPVGLSAYAAAGVAGTNPISTSMQAFLLGLAGFVVPYIIIYSPALILIGDVSSIVIVSITALLGVTSMAGALVGWFFRPLNWAWRLALLVGAIALIHPNPAFAIGGIVPMLTIFGRSRIGQRQALT